MMKSRSLVVIAVCCVCFSFEKHKSNTNHYLQEKNDLLLWNSSHKLTWGDFMSDPDKKSAYKAMTYVQIGLDSKQDEEIISVDVPCFFARNLSWTMKKTITLLKHEQLHFDIAELIARKIRMEYSNYKSEETTKTYKDLQEIYRINYKVTLDSINKKYDTETRHSVVEQEQKKWEVYVASELKKLDKYASTRVVIKLEE